MPTAIPILSKQLPAYHKEDALVFQFLLNEWLLASRCNFELSCQIDKLLEKSNSKRVFQDLSAHLKKLSGNQHHFIRFIAPGDDSLLKKLSHFSAILARDITDARAEERLFRKSANQALGFAIELEHILVSIKETSKENLGAGLERMKNQGEKITAELKKMGRTILKLFGKFAKDENVLFFILRHKKDFDSLQGNGFVRKIIIKNYPKGLLEAEVFLINRYTKRGFNELISLIKMLMQDLKK